MKNMSYGVIGNCRTAALVSAEGNIEWCCLPYFDSTSFFAKILDREKGGEFGIETDGCFEITQQYLSMTNILVTRFTGEEGAFEVVDFMPRYKTENGRHYYPPDIVRYIRLLSGRPAVRFVYRPRPAYAEHPAAHVMEDDYFKSYTTAGTYESIYLYSSFPLEKIRRGEEVVIDRDHYFLLSYNQKLLSVDIEQIYLLFERTKVYWLNWAERTIRFSRYNEEITRSALVLKLLTYQPSGAILAAVTTSLPETVGAVRNWDYRFCWLRDSSMMISTLKSIGHYNSAQRFLNFLIGLAPLKGEKIQIMYGIRGEKALTERELSWLTGYKGSRPVRVGNAAYRQKQNDIYGVLIDIIHKHFEIFRSTVANSEELWTIVRSLVRTVINNWQKPDRGIWEYRSQERHFVFSKVLCWVALDRGVKIARLLRRGAMVEPWSKVRDQIKADILKHGWNEEVGAFTQSYGSRDLDAANLLTAVYGFIDPRDPRYVRTVLKTRKDLSRDGLMYRYRNKDDFGRPESSFTICTFWMIKSLCLIGEKEEAEKMFHRVLQYANHLQLFSEDLSFETKELLGNFPQGYSHLALIDVATTLAEAVDEEEKLLQNLQYTF